MASVAGVEKARDAEEEVRKATGMDGGDYRALAFIPSDLGSPWSILIRK